MAQVLRSGAKLTFVDSLPDTWNLDPRLVEASITERTRAIIAVGLEGLPAGIDEICVLARTRGISVIEDAPEADCQVLDAKRLGTFGNIAYSRFYRNRLITLGEGGIILANRPDFIEAFWR